MLEGGGRREGTGMPSKNAGVVALNDRPVQAGAAVAYCVLGMPRGGTTMVAKLLQCAGVFMGEAMPYTAEDPAFAALLREPRPDIGAFDALVAKRNASHGAWGFKAPFRNHWDILRSIPNCRFVAVFRDILAVGNRNRISVNADLIQSMQANLALEAGLLKFISSIDNPVLLLSYEKALVETKEVVEELIRFTGGMPAPELRARMADIVQPSEAGYLAAQGANPGKAACHIDVLSKERVAGWARYKTGENVFLELLFDDVVVAKGLAQIRRSDLAQRFGGDGGFGFDLAVANFGPANGPISVTVRDGNQGTILVRKRLD